jgi:type II secretory pathway component GspD/PulD (secretin)
MLSMLSLNKRNLVLALAVSAAIGGCATTQQSERESSVSKAVASDTNSIKNDAPTYGLKHINSPAAIPGGMVERAGLGRGEVNLTANGPLSSMIASISGGYSVTYVSEVDRNKIIAVSLKNLSVRAAVKQIAMNAGYVAIVEGNTITIANEATYTFRIPSRLLNAQTSNYSVGGNPLSNSGSSSGGIGGGTSGSSVTATFTAAGRTNTGADVIAHIKAIAGNLASVSVTDAGFITVRANGIALERVRKFLNDFVYDGNRRADIKVSVIEVSINDKNTYGIDWTKVLSRVGGALSVGISGGAATVAASSLAINYTSASISSVIDALQTESNVRVLTQPTISAMNRVPAVLFDGSTIPYVGQIMSLSQQTNTSVSATASYATDGVSLSLLADIQSDTESQIQLIPVLTSVQEFKTFNLGTLGSIVAPLSVEKHSLMNATVENGQTVILGGIRINKVTGSKTQIPLTKLNVGAANNDGAKELVILMQSTVIAPKQVDTLLTESL